jgi:HSP20 family protein
MSRQTLPQTLQFANKTALFPTLQKKMIRLLDEFKTSFPKLEDAGQSAVAGTSFPAINVVETYGAVEVSAEVQGAEESDLDRTVSGETLILKGKKTADHEDKKDGLHLIEQDYGSFRRQIPLGFAPEEGGSQAGTRGWHSQADHCQTLSEKGCLTENQHQEKLTHAEAS